MGCPPIRNATSTSLIASADECRSSRPRQLRIPQNSWGGFFGIRESRIRVRLVVSPFWGDKKSEIGRILHLKVESGNRRSDCVPTGLSLTLYGPREHGPNCDFHFPL